MKAQLSFFSISIAAFVLMQARLAYCADISEALNSCRQELTIQRDECRNKWKNAEIVIDGYVYDVINNNKISVKSFYSVPDIYEPISVQLEKPIGKYFLKNQRIKLKGYINRIDFYDPTEPMIIRADLQNKTTLSVINNHCEALVLIIDEYESPLAKKSRTSYKVIPGKHTISVCSTDKQNCSEPKKIHWLNEMVEHSITEGSNCNMTTSTENDDDGNIKWKVVAPGLVNVRSGPGTQYDIVGTVQNGDSIEVSEHKDSWIHISNGWINSDYADSTN